MGVDPAAYEENVVVDWTTLPEMMEDRGTAVGLLLASEYEGVSTSVVVAETGGRDTVSLGITVEGAGLSTGMVVCRA